MRKWTTFRRWLNRNDGNLFVVDNIEINAFQALAGILVLPAILVLAEKVPGVPREIGWLLMFVVAGLTVVGSWRAKSDHDAT